MMKCPSCHATLRNEETKCFRCDSVIEPPVKKVTIQDRFRSGLTVAFVLSCMLTIGSIFTDLLPSFTKCLVVTVVLLLVRSSAQQMAEKS
jgi:hypothetical protein